jgi:hypothetical protein
VITDCATDNLVPPASVALSGEGGGSGFYLCLPGALYLVTAKHVLFDSATERLLAPTATIISYPLEPKHNAPPVMTAQLDRLLPIGGVNPHPSQDIAVIRIGAFDEPEQSEAQTRIRKCSLLEELTLAEAGTEIVAAGRDHVKTFAEVSIDNSIVIGGYATAIGTKRISPRERVAPMLRHGVIAGANAEKKLLVVDCPAYTGNTGGPVFEITQLWPQVRFKLIGLLTQLVPFDSPMLKELTAPLQRNVTQSAYAVVTAIDYVLELTN